MAEARPSALGVSGVMVRQVQRGWSGARGELTSTLIAAPILRVFDLRDVL